MVLELVCRPVFALLKVIIIFYQVNYDFIDKKLPYMLNHKL